MTRHNLAIHISWLLSNEVTPLVSVHTTPAVPPKVSRSATEPTYAGSEEDDVEERIPSPLPSPSPNRRVVQIVNVAPDFRRPLLPSKDTPKLLPGEPQKSFADESMGKLSSGSRPARPGLVGQHQLATPASTTGSTSSLMQGYSSMLRENGVVKISSDRNNS
jgi:bloom syndrome protein